MSVADRMKRRRVQLGYNADHVAKKLGVSRSTIFRYENGDIEKMPVDIVEKLAKVLDTTPGYLMGWSDESTPPWASHDEIIELDELLSSGAYMAYGGERLTEEEKQRVNDVLTAIFWEKAEKRRKEKND